MGLPAKNGWQPVAKCNTVTEKEHVMSNENFTVQPIISTDAETAAKGVADMVNRQRRTKRKQPASCLAQSILLIWCRLIERQRRRVRRLFVRRDARRHCSGICEELAPKDYTNGGEPDKATVNKMLSSANDAVGPCC